MEAHKRKTPARGETGRGLNQYPNKANHTDIPTRGQAGNVGHASAPAIVAALGGRWHGGYGMARCPAHNDRTPSLAITAGPDGRPLVYCHAGCEQASVIGALQARGLWSSRLDMPPAPPRPDAREEKRAEAARRIWGEAFAVTGTVAELYLQARGIDIPPPASLRFAPSLKHGPTGLHFPTLIAAVQDGSDRTTAVHRTYLLPDGSGKARVSSPKMALGRLTGGAVRLAQAKDRVWLTEGIEDGLSLVQMFGEPAWAVLGTSGFRNVDLPERIRAVVLAPDNDPAGQGVIDQAATRLAGQGREVRIARPPKGRDWNDLLFEYGERAAILEFDQQAPRSEAERLALMEVMGVRYE